MPAVRLEHWQRMVVANIDGYSGAAPIRIQSALDVYLQNSIGARQNALRSNYPVVAEILGHRYFSMLTTKYIIQHRSADCNLNLYGSDFDKWLGTKVRHSPELSSMPYLPDLASLEFAWSRALWVAAPSAIASNPAKPQERSSLIKNPTLSLVSSVYEIDVLWRRHRDNARPEEIRSLERRRFFAIYRKPEHSPTMERIEDADTVSDITMMDTMPEISFDRDLRRMTRGKLSEYIEKGYVISHVE